MEKMSFALALIAPSRYTEALGCIQKKVDESLSSAENLYRLRAIPRQICQQEITSKLQATLMEENKLLSEAKELSQKVEASIENISKIQLDTSDLLKGSKIGAFDKEMPLTVENIILAVF